MANSEHMQWLLEGVDIWNAKRKQHPFTPDLGNADIYEEFLKSGKLSPDDYIPFAGMDLRRANFSRSRLSTPYREAGADLTKANLRSANFEYANLANARLDDAVLVGARFNNADLAGAGLHRAAMGSTAFIETNLFGADFTEASAGVVSLQKANLSHATLLNADFRSTDLTGTILDGSRPWQAVLYQDTEVIRQNTHTQYEYDDGITCVADLIEKCAGFDKETACSTFGESIQIHGSYGLLLCDVRRETPAGYVPVKAICFLTLWHGDLRTSRARFQLFLNGCWRSTTDSKRDSST